MISSSVAMMMTLRMRPERGSFGASFGTSSAFFIPSGVSSKAQARNSATGRPSSSRTISICMTQGRCAERVGREIDNLGDQPADHRVGDGDAEHVAAFQLGNQAHWCTRKNPPQTIAPWRAKPKPCRFFPGHCRSGILRVCCHGPNMSLRHALIVAAVLAVLCLVACGGADPAAAGKVLHRGLSSDPESLDPQKARSTQAADVLRDIGEGLVAYSATGELQPAAAASWEIATDGLRYTFTLREGARWSNGDPVTSADFVLGLQRLVDPATAAFYGGAVSAIVNAPAIIAGERPVAALGVSAPDPRTVVIELDQPTPYLLGLLTHPSTFPVHGATVAKQGDEFPQHDDLVSNGAYRLADWRPGSLVELVKNEHYWNAANVDIDVVRHHVIAQEIAELNRFRAGELHITSNVPPDNFEQVRRDYPDELRIAPYLGVYYYGFNLTKPPFAGNPELRKALSMAIDRELIVDKTLGRGEVPAWSWVPEGVDNYRPVKLSFAGASQSERNAIAKSLYAAAGYGPDNPAQIELRYNTSDSQRRIALAIESMWRETLGVEVTLINEEFQVLLANMRAREVTQVYRSSWIGDYNDAHTFLSVLGSTNPANTPGYANDEYDELMARAASQLDTDRRRLYLEEAERILLADHAVIPIYFYVSKHLVSGDVGGWGDNVLDYHYSQHLTLNGNDDGND